MKLSEGRTSAADEDNDVPFLRRVLHPSEFDKSEFLLLSVAEIEQDRKEQDNDPKVSLCWLWP